ncbi:MAG: chemotaxis protein CheY [Nitrospinaceae bacterium]|nr:MAG: chemotaxis protein CheY [Nitrospinaceae bacterium]
MNAESKKHKLLLVDDEAHIRTLIKTLAQSLDFEVIAEAENGQEAVERFQSESPDMTILDINMPVKTGIEALREIKKIDPGALVIMMTSRNDLETVTTAIKLGARGYILKDNPNDKIKSRIEKAWQEFGVSE